MTRFLLAFAAWLIATIPLYAGVRIKDVTSVQGLREHQLVGYGLVVGLQASGDTLRNAAFTEQALQSMLDRLGVNVGSSALRTRNVAAVLVTAELPPFAGRGSRIDVTVSSLGDASSLAGGTLISTMLTAGDGNVYAVSQGQVTVTGFAAQGQAESVTQGTPTVGRIAGGATIERELSAGGAASGNLVLELRNPDFHTVIAITDAINAHTNQRFKQRTATERDYRTIALVRPAGIGVARFMAEIGDLVIEPDSPARVVVDARSGTVVIGQDVTISTVAVTHGAIAVRITETPVVSQPQPLSRGTTAVVPQTNIEAEQPGGQIALVGGANLRTLVRGLNQIGLKPSGIIAILQAIKSAGALHAELIVQ